MCRVLQALLQVLMLQAFFIFFQDLMKCNSEWAGDIVNESLEFEDVPINIPSSSFIKLFLLIFQLH